MASGRASRGNSRSTARSGDAAAALAKELGPQHRSFGLDVTNAAQRSELVKSLQGIQLSCVVHNAAIYERDSAHDAAKRTIETNVFAPLELSLALEPLLTPDARVVFVSSGLSALHAYSNAIAQRLQSATTIDEVRALTNEYLSASAQGHDSTTSADAAERAGFNRDPYGVSKALVNSLARAFAARWPKRVVVAASPGWVQTDMGGKGAPRTLAQGVSRIAEATIANVTSGRFFEHSDAFS